MKIKVPVTKSVIARIDGETVNDVKTLESFGHVTPSSVIKENPGFTCIKQSKSHVSYDVPDDMLFDFLEKHGTLVKTEKEGN